MKVRMPFIASRVVYWNFGDIRSVSEMLLTALINTRKIFVNMHPYIGYKDNRLCDTSDQKLSSPPFDLFKVIRPKFKGHDGFWILGVKFLY